MLAQTLADSEAEQSIRQHIPRVLQRIGNPQAAAILLGRLKEPARSVRGAIFAP